MLAGTNNHWIASTRYSEIIEQICFLVGNDPKEPLKRASEALLLKTSCQSKERIPLSENGTGWVLDRGIAPLSGKPSGETRRQTALIRVLWLCVISTGASWRSYVGKRTRRHSKPLCYPDSSPSFMCLVMRLQGFTPITISQLGFTSSQITTALMSFEVSLPESESEFPSYPHYPHGRGV